MTSTTGTRRRPHQPRRVLAAFTALTLGTGFALASGLSAGAAPGDESHASGTVLSGTLLAGLTPTQLALIGAAEASNDGTQPTQVEEDDLDATVLQALTIDIGGGVQVPLTLGDAGALQSYARAEADGTSVGAAGMVGDDGAIGVGAPGAGAPPSGLTIDLTDLLSGAIATELTDIDLSLGAVSAGATSTAGGAPVGTYEITGGELVITSSTLADTPVLLAGAITDLETAIAALEGDDGALIDDIVAIPDLLGVVGVEPGATATIDVDFTGVLDTLDLTPRSLGAVTIDPTTGLITIDLETLNGGSLNGLAANTNVLTATQLADVVTQIDALIDDILGDAEALIDDVLEDAVIDIDLGLTVDLGLGAGVEPLATITVDGPASGPLAATVTAIGGVPLGVLTDTAVTDAVDALVDGLFVDVVDLLDAEVADAVLTPLDPALDGLAGVVALTVNNQAPFPAVTETLFTETAFRLSLLGPGLTLDIAQATVGPNFVDVAPTITTLDPDEGPETGGTAVTITGTGLVGSTGVTFDGIPGTGFTVVSDTEITVVTPPHTPATVDVLIQHPSGPSLPGDFTYTPLISVGDIDPNFGPEAGGTDVTIIGTCFTGATGVTFDGIPGTAFTVVSDTEITVTSPAHAAGAVDVVVLGAVACGGSTTVPDGFVYVAPGAPVITSIVPDEGPESGGTAVTLTGTGFTGATGVTFDGVPATAVVVVNDTTITAVSPPHAPGIVGVVVTAPGPDSGPLDFTYTPLIGVSAIDPGFGPRAGGTVVDITGTCFTGATDVLFDGVSAASFTVDSDTSITATTPAGTPGFVDVTIIGTVVCGGVETVPDAFEYIDADAPVIASLTPSSGPQTGGTAVTVSGSGFLGATGVTFDDIAGTSFVVVDDSTITIVSPAHAVGPAPVRVEHPDGRSAPLNFLYLPATVVDDVDPGTGPVAGGTTVTITGSCFTGATAVLFDGVAATSFTVVSDVEITAVTPAGTGTVDVTVVGATACGTGTLDDGFAYVSAGGGLANSGAVIWPLLAVVLGLFTAGGLIVAARRWGFAG